MATPTLNRNHCAHRRCHGWPDHGDGRHTPHRIIHRPTAHAQPPQAPETQATGPAAVGARPYTVADLAAGVQRLHADRERLADLDTLLDDVDHKAKELERRTRELLQE